MDNYNPKFFAYYLEEIIRKAIKYDISEKQIAKTIKIVCENRIKNNAN